MFKHIFELIPNIANYPLFSLVLFFILFSVISYWAFFKAKKSYIQKMEQLPLDSSTTSLKNGD